MQTTLNWLIKLDIAVIISFMGLLIAGCQAYKQWQRELQRDREKGNEERVLLRQEMKFASDRLDRIESWISGNSGFKGS